MPPAKKQRSPLLLPLRNAIAEEARYRKEVYGREAAKARLLQRKRALASIEELIEKYSK
ncbi:MAG: hypothetical protein AABW59_00230 [archaeon]